MTKTSKCEIHSKKYSLYLMRRERHTFIGAVTATHRPNLISEIYYSNCIVWMLCAKNPQYVSKRSKIIFQYQRSILYSMTHYEDIIGVELGSLFPSSLLIRHCAFKLSLVPFDAARIERPLQK